MRWRTLSGVSFADGCTAQMPDAKRNYSPVRYVRAEAPAIVRGRRSWLGSWKLGFGGWNLRVGSGCGPEVAICACAWCYRVCAPHLGRVFARHVSLFAHALEQLVRV